MKKLAGVHFKYLPKNFLVSFTNEKIYADKKFLYPRASCQFFNALEILDCNYFSPYKYLTDKNWIDVLSEMVKKLYDAIDEYNELFKAAVNIFDKHSNTPNR